MVPEVPSEHDDAASAAGRAPERAARGPRGAKPGETPGPLTSRPPSNPISYGGEDWLTLSLYVRHREFAETTKRLDEARRAAEERRRGDDELTLAGRKFLVRPLGAKVGSGRSGAYFRWQLQSETGFVLQLMNVPLWTGTMPNAKLVASSLVMMQLGIDEVVRQARDALRALGAVVERDKVSRVDVCCDLPGRSMEPLLAAYDAGHLVCRATRSDEHFNDDYVVGSDCSMYRIGRERTSFNLGRGDVRLRVYEKVEECRYDLKKLRVLVQRRWGEFPYRAIRVEYQLRREKLKQLGVDDFEDWLDKRAAVVRYLTHEWCRLTAGPVDRKHPDRTPVLAEWLDVQAGFAAWAGDGPGPDLGPIASQPMPPDRFLKSIVGSFVSLFALGGVAIDDNETFAHEALARLLDEIEQRDMAREVGRRALERGYADVGPRPALPPSDSEGE
ncbi:MAG: hypothetical protein KF847_20740 [Pirellulales bacterium]|nr:hypothetical protein [Pirellulales bacterium]